MALALPQSIDPHFTALIEEPTNQKIWLAIDLVGVLLMLVALALWCPREHHRATPAEPPVGDTRRVDTRVIALPFSKPVINQNQPHKDSNA